ncbi:MAG: hypothetical protein ACNA75_04320 [Thiohalomonadaceae bacterium]
MSTSLSTLDSSVVTGGKQTGFLQRIANDPVPKICIIVVSGGLGFSGTSSAEPMHLWEAPYTHQLESTASSPDGQFYQHSNKSQAGEDTGHAVAEIRRLSGLTWEQLGELFGVSRRSAHFWASGKPLSAANEERLMQVLDIIREGYRGDARSTRAALFSVIAGTTPFELLASERFAEARKLFGKGAERMAERADLSPAARTARRPLPPEEMVAALNDKVHRDVGKGRAARIVRKKRSGA